MKYKHGEIQVGTVMIGASHVYFVKTVDTSDCGQVQTCAQSDVLTKHGGMEGKYNDGLWRFQISKSLDNWKSC